MNITICHTDHSTSGSVGRLHFLCLCCNIGWTSGMTKFAMIDADDSADLLISLYRYFIRNNNNFSTGATCSGYLNLTVRFIDTNQSTNAGTFRA